MRQKPQICFTRFSGLCYSAVSKYRLPKLIYILHSVIKIITQHCNIFTCARFRLYLGDKRKRNFRGENSCLEEFRIWCHSNFMLWSSFVVIKLQGLTPNQIYIKMICHKDFFSSQLSQGYLNSRSKRKKVQYINKIVDPSVTIISKNFTSYIHSINDVCCLKAPNRVALPNELQWTDGGTKLASKQGRNLQIIPLEKKIRRRLTITLVFVSFHQREFDIKMEIGQWWMLWSYSYMALGSIILLFINCTQYCTLSDNVLCIHWINSTAH